MAESSSLLAVFLVATVVCAVVYAQDQEGEALKTVSQSNLEFTQSLFKILSRKEGNILFSPVSIHTILGLTSLGARGTTAQQMVQGLHLPTDRQTTKDNFRNITKALRAIPNVTLKVANKIFTDTRFPPEEEFAQTARDDFQSASEVVDFGRRPEDARSRVNEWVEENTDHKITNLLREGSVTNQTAMILANAAYFKANWAVAFNTSATQPERFHISAEVKQEIPMMCMEIKDKFGFVFSRDLDARLLEIPYEGERFSLVIILPRKRNGLRDVETKLAEADLGSIMSIPVAWFNIKVSIPKFTLEEKADLKEPLKQMGMTSMFGDDVTDFSLLAPGDLSVSSVTHMAFIEVNEQGTQAAAATAVMTLTRSGPARFSANHPFLFMIRDKETNVVLFMGRYARP